MPPIISLFCLLIVLTWLCSSAQATDCKFIYNNDKVPSNTKLMNAVKGKRYSCNDEKSPKYKYDVGVCAPAVSDKTGQSGGNIDYQLAGALQAETKGDEVKFHVLGQYTHAEFVQGYDWLMLEYFDGDAYHTHCNGTNRNTILMISCKPGQTNGLLKLVEERNDKISNCYYVFELLIDAACQEINTGLSVGSILCIVFLCLVGVYLLFGFLYQRFMKGAQGYEQVPNYSFWRELGNLSADGCNFVFRSDSLSEPRQYRGISGDNLPENEDITRDSDRDDQLLNM